MAPLSGEKGESLDVGGSPYTFLGLKGSLNSWENALAVIIPIPYDGTTTYVSGAREGPKAIIMASRELEPYDEEMNIEPYRFGIHTLAELPVDIKSPVDTIAIVEDVALRVLDSRKLPILVGGEHLMTLGMISALKNSDSYNDISILHLDAHADLRDEYQGSSFSNACVIRRTVEKFPVVSVGVRSLTREEHEFATRKNIPLFFAHKLRENPTLYDDILNLLSDHVYITIDLDVFDPSVMPAVGTPEPGGLGWYEVTNLLKRICLAKHIIGFDIMELRPIPGMIYPDFTAAKLLYKILAYIFSKQR